MDVHVMNAYNLQDKQRTSSQKNGAHASRRPCLKESSVEIDGTCQKSADLYACMLAGVAACEWSIHQIDNASNEQTIMSYLTNDAKLTAQIDAANDTRRYAYCKQGSNECARRSHEQLHRQLRQCKSQRTLPNITENLAREIEGAACTAHDVRQTHWAPCASRTRQEPAASTGAIASMVA